MLEFAQTLERGMLYTELTAESAWVAAAPQAVQMI